MTRARTQRRRNDERGFFTIWVLGLCMCVLFLGGLSFDLWQGFSERRQIAAMVDAAAIAGASEINLAVFRETGDVVLDENGAVQRALAYLSSASADANVTLTNADAGVVNGQVVVTAAVTYSPTLTKVLVADGDFTIEATGAAEPARAASDPRL